MPKFDRIKNIVEQEEQNADSKFEEQLKQAYNNSIKKPEPVVETTNATKPVNLTLEAPKKQKDIKIAISARIDKTTRDKINDIIFAYKLFNPASTLSFNEILNVALEEWSSKKEHIEIRKKLEEMKKNI